MNQFTTSIWGDEGFSAILSMKSLPEIIKIIATDTSPPLWNIFEWIVFNTLGTDEVYIRGLAFLFYALTIFFVYLIGKLLWNKKTGIITATLTALNPFFFIYAFEGRMYSILALGVTASMYFFMRIRKEKGDPRVNGVGYVIATLWALYSHHFAIFALILQGFWFFYAYFFGNRNAAKKLFLLFIAVGIGYLPWLLPLYNQTKMVGGGFWLGKPTVNDLGKLLGDYLAQGIKHSLNQVSLVLVMAILITRRWKRRPKSSVFIISWFLGPILLTWVVSQFFQSIFYNRYLLYTIPAAMLIVGSSRRKASEVLIAILLLTFVIVDFNYFTNPIKLPFKELGAYVEQTRQDGDYFINWNAGSHHLWETKYYGFDSPIYIPEGGDLPFFVGTALMEDADVTREIPESTTRVGVTTSGDIAEIELPGYTESEVKILGNLKFVWYEKESL
jgi:uncharacterized membrane protein